jgi:hypothetical protein
MPPRLTIKRAEEALKQEVQKLDKRVQILSVVQGKKKDAYRIVLAKDGRSSKAELKKDVVKEFLSEEGKGNALRKALGKAVSHLSIQHGR